MAKISMRAKDVPCKKLIKHPRPSVQTTREFVRKSRNPTPHPSTRSTQPILRQRPFHRSRNPPNPRSLPLPPRKSTNTVLWCAPNTRTYLILEKAPTLAASASIQTLLVSAANVVAAQLRDAGDGAIRTGLFHLMGPEAVSLYAQNADNHQQTWGVLEAALAVLWDYMAQFGFGGARAGLGGR
ncbi:MAG: hypothetical protein FRX48_01967 [Lasallia pustulata]|uniref:Uncharacterized protein n=1 Tax=Lasallia pustulata TaxID=136370 RepID=A0A5M8Q2J6_9LECA|nr:MAG: hypothetical protein FRX48_01967 [Lasallia pustulata]